MKLRNFTIMFLFSLFLGLGISEAQTFTPITATITADGYFNFAYYNGTWSAVYYNPSSTLPPVYTKTGVKVQTIYSGTLDGTGTFTQSMPDTSSISPAGGSWKFTVCPDSSASCTPMAAISLTGGSTIDLSTIFSNQITIPQLINPIQKVGFGYNYNAMLNYNPPTVNSVLGSFYVTVPNSAGIEPYHIWFNDFDGWHDLSTGSTPTIPTCVTLATDFVCTDPTTGQIVTQPINTLFQVQGQSFFGNLGQGTLLINGVANEDPSVIQDETGLGANALAADLDGGDNVAIGWGALAADTAGYNSVAIGYDAMSTYNDSASADLYGNVAIGNEALSIYTGGDGIGGNTAVGNEALLEVGYGNVGLGNNAGGGTVGGNYELYINSSPFATTDDTIYSLIWGRFSGADNSFANSQLTFNAQFLHFPHITATPCATGSALYQDTSTDLNDGVKTDSSGCAITTITSVDSSVTVVKTGNTADLSVKPAGTTEIVLVTGCDFPDDGANEQCSMAGTLSPAMPSGYTVSCVERTDGLSTVVLDTLDTPVTTSVNSFSFDERTQGSSAEWTAHHNYGKSFLCTAYHP